MTVGAFSFHARVTCSGVRRRFLLSRGWLHIRQLDGKCHQNSWINHYSALEDEETFLWRKKKTSCFWYSIDGLVISCYVNSRKQDNWYEFSEQAPCEITKCLRKKWIEKNESFQVFVLSRCRFWHSMGSLGFSFSAKDWKVLRSRW